MLVLSRKEGERICIGDTIWVTVVKIKGNSIRLGIDAPDQKVLRGELVQEEPSGGDSKAA